MRRSNGMFWLIGLGIAAVLVITIALAPSYFKEKTVTTEVISKERVCDNSGTNGAMECKYLVFTENGTFKITDSLFGTVRFNSSDVYGRIREGHTYTITYYGFRLPFFSEYPNIKKVEEVK